MVGITAILAAVIGSFVLGIGGEVEQVPQASWSLSEDNGDLLIAHQGGDDIVWSDVSVKIDGGSDLDLPDDGSSELALAGEATIGGSYSEDSTARIDHDSSRNIIPTADL